MRLKKRAHEKPEGSEKLTSIHAHDKPQRMGRKKEFSERLHVTLPEGAKDRIDSVLREGEDRLDMIRGAINKEVMRRERQTGREAEEKDVS